MSSSFLPAGTLRQGLTEQPHAPPAEGLSVGTCVATLCNSVRLSAARVARRSSAEPQCGVRWRR
jgi:hypothetical protein